MSTYIQLTIEVTTGADLALDDNVEEIAVVIDPLYVTEGVGATGRDVFEGTLLAWSYVPEEDVP